eukprot:5631515-Pleurochrysis_carterae.AAC.2
MEMSSERARASTHRRAASQYAAAPKAAQREHSAQEARSAVSFAQWITCTSFQVLTQDFGTQRRGKAREGERVSE